MERSFWEAMLMPKGPPGSTATGALTSERSSTGDHMSGCDCVLQCLALGWRKRWEGEGRREEIKFAFDVA